MASLPTSNRIAFLNDSGGQIANVHADLAGVQIELTRVLQYIVVQPDHHIAAQIVIERDEQNEGGDGKVQAEVQNHIAVLDDLEVALSIARLRAGLLIGIPRFSRSSPRHRRLAVRLDCRNCCSFGTR